MKKKLFVVLAGAFVLCAAIFFGCNNPAGSDIINIFKYTPASTGSYETLFFEELEQAVDPITSEELTPPKYYSLTSGEEITGEDITSNKWDIAVQLRGCFPVIFTNSGDSVAAAGGGYEGRGGVWYTEKTDFNAVSLFDMVRPGDPGFDEDLEDYLVDKTVWVSAMGMNPGYRLNVMTYMGYSLSFTGTGTSSEDPFTTLIPVFTFNKKAFLDWTSGMPPPFAPTNRVYIVRHGDGAGYSKLQVPMITVFYNASYISFATPLEIRYKNLATSFTTGTYTAMAPGFGGYLTVSATFLEDAITGITVISHKESYNTNTYVKQAIDTLPQNIIDNQNLNVDIVAGASITSKAIINAVKDCVIQAGREPADLEWTAP
jgi:uncharacterized protein with FMN-binding domain